MDKTTSVDSVFKNRFSNLLEEKGLNQKEAAEKIGITRQAVNLYVSGKRTPDINTIYKICDYFHISSDYLLGLSDVQSVNIDIKAISEKTGLSDYSIEILEEYYLEAGTDQLIRTLNFLLENVPRFKINYFSEEEFKNIFEISKKDDLTKEEKTIFKNFKEKLIAGEEWEKSHFDLLSSIDKYLNITCNERMELSISRGRGGKYTGSVNFDDNGLIADRNKDIDEIMEQGLTNKFELKKLLDAAMLVEIQNHLQHLKESFVERYVVWEYEENSSKEV